MVLFGDGKFQHKIRRITADIDSMSPFRLHWSLLIFKILGFKHEITIKISQSKKGRHVIAWAKHKGLSREFLFIARIIAGDDRFRVKKDKEDRMIQILWDKKEDLNGGKMTNPNFDVPRYYDMDFKGRKPKYCPDCKSKMEYDGWECEVETQKLSEFWFCKKCDKLIKNPE